MKQGKRPTKKQKIMIAAAKGLVLENWLVERETPTQLVLIHRKSGKPKTINKGA
ncbi:DUF6906 family protein [Paenibacillus sophorae]|uniref:DUF6906 family protein n=1 Tax=Paenibacillus sophorae TaxID=1333845 RepID=UPI0004B0AE70